MPKRGAPTIAYIFATALVGASCGQNEVGEVEPDVCSVRACPVLCAGDTECGNGQQCSNGMCENLPPTSNDYLRCYLDIDCPQGDHCSVGVCAHECVSTNDCVEGSGCTARGRCMPEETLDAATDMPPAPPPETPQGALLAVSDAALDFGGDRSRLVLPVANPGDQELTVRVLSEPGWVSATPPLLRVPAGDSRPITVDLDRGRADSTVGQVTIASNAGELSLPVVLQQSVTGYYVGSLRTDTPADLGSVPFAVDLRQTDDALAGVVNARFSPTLPWRSAVAGTMHTTGEVTEVSLELEATGERGSQVNPAYPLPLRHTYTLEGTVGAGHIAGTFLHTMEGVLPGEALEQTGTFILIRQGEPLNLPAAQPSGAFEEQPVPPLSWSSPPIDCSVCPAGHSCDGTPASVRRAMLEAAFPFYELFYSGDLYHAEATCRGDGGDVSDCFQPAYAYCAMELAAADAATDAVAAGDLLDTVKGLASYWTLASTHRTVGALTTLGDQLVTRSTIADELIHAKFNADRALHGRVGEVPPLPKTLDPFVLSLMWPTSSPVATAIAGRQSTFREPSTSPNPEEQFRVRPHRDLWRITLAQRAQLFAALERLRILHGLGEYAEAESLARATLTQGHVDAIITAQLLARHGGDPDQALVRVRGFLRDIAHLYEEVQARHTPAGIDEHGVRWMLRSGNIMDSTNFDIVLGEANERLGLLADAEAAYDYQTRTWEEQANSLRTQLQYAEDTYSAQLQMMCGNQVTSVEAPGYRIENGMLAQCSGGEAANNIREIEAAQLQATMAVNELNNLAKRIEIETRRLARILGINASLIELTLKNGEKRKVLVDRQREIQQIQAGVNTITGFASGAVSGAMSLAAAGPWGMVAGALLGGISGAASGATELWAAGERAKIEKDQLELAAREQATILEAQDDVAAAESAARIQTWMLEEPNLHIQISLANLRVLQAAQRQYNLMQQAQFLVERMRTASDTLSDATFDLRDPSERLFVSKDLALYTQAFSSARTWAFLAARAYEYELNVTLSDRTKPFEVNSRSELAGFLLMLQDYFDLHWTEPQPASDLISLRRHILGIEGETVDPDTGETVSAKERFLRYLLAPECWDAQGRLRFVFSTAPSDGVRLFSANVFNDKITGVRVNLVGDELGDRNASVILEQNGLNLVRDNSGVFQPYQLGDRATRLQAGVNLDITRDPTIPEGIELMGRSVYAETWALVIDTRSDREPLNTDIDLTTLYDVEILLKHEAASF